MRTCTKCGEVKESCEFPLSKKTRSCKACNNKASRERYLRNKEAILSKTREYREANRNKALAYNKSHYYMRTFGLTAEEYLQKKQSASVCPICKIRPVEHLDHNHETGKIRDFLCGECNRGLGVFQDNPDILRAAADYLESHRS